MFTARSLPRSCLSALPVVWALSSPVQAQTSGAVAAPTDRDFSIEPAQTSLPFEGMFQPYFQVVGGTVALMETKIDEVERGGVHYYVSSPVDVTLWSKPLGTTPINFTFEVGDYDETLKDSNGLIVWSHSFKKPSFTLTLSQDNEAAFTDENGRVLWSGLLPHSYQGFLSNAATKPLAPYTGRSTTDTYNYLYGNDLVTLQNADGQTLWSGKSERNCGLLVNDASSTQRPQIIGVPSVLLPPHTSFHIEVTSEKVNMSVCNVLGQQMTVLPLRLLKLAVTSDDVQLQDRFTAMRAGIILPQDDLPSFPTVKFAPKQAAYSVTYRDERGVFLYGQRYSVFRLAPNEEAAFMSTYPNGIAEQYTVYRALETEVDKNGRQEGPSSTDTWLVHR